MLHVTRRPPDHSFARTNGETVTVDPTPGSGPSLPTSGATSASASRTGAEGSAVPSVTRESLTGQGGPALRPAALPAAVTEGRVSGLRRVLVVLDAVAVACAWVLGSMLDTGDNKLASHPLRTVGIGIALVVLSYGLAKWQGLYLSRVGSMWTVTILRVARVAIALTAVLAAVELMLARTPSLTQHIFGGFLTFAFILIGRMAFQRWIRQGRIQGRYSRPVIIIGDIDERAALADLLRFHPEIGFRAVGFIGDAPLFDPLPSQHGHNDARRHGTHDHGPETAEIPWLGPMRRTLSAINATGASGVVVAANALPSMELNSLLRELIDAGVHVHISTGLQGICHRRLRSLPFAHEPLFYIEPAGLVPHELFVKRCLDVVIAAVMLVLTAPLLGVAAAVIKLSDGGSVLFRQQRVGRDGEAFTMLKLRTMVPNAEAQMERLRARNQRTGPLFKLNHDPRITRVGRMLRATSIDELPQLWNVLRGQLSLVGPRPALAEEVAEFDAQLLGRLRMRPGLTGLWQVEGRHNPSFYAYRHLDLFYIENWSLSLDLIILASTIPSVLASGLSGLRRNRPNVETHELAA
jgi:exopolysaccharide biosynthesis polyprenyl glycosylphosphotransferase